MEGHLNYNDTFQALVPPHKIYVNFQSQDPNLCVFSLYVKVVYFTTIK